MSVGSAVARSGAVERAGEERTPFFAVGFAVAAAITALAISLAASAPGAGPLSQTSRVVLALLGVNFRDASDRLKVEVALWLHELGRQELALFRAERDGRPLA